MTAFCEPMLDKLAYWIRERESIRMARSRGEGKPWTDDPILRAYRFCNVRRMDDRVSSWLYTNWYLPNLGHSGMLAAVCLARFINSPDTLWFLGFPTRWEPELIKGRVRKLAAEGRRVYNPAYMIRGNEGADKIATVVDYTISPLLSDRPTIDTGSMRDTWKTIHGRFGFGSFMAGQVVADLRWAVSGDWSDRNEWAPLGPGSTRGMNRLLGRDIKARLRQEDFESLLREMIEVLKTLVPLSVCDRLEAMDYQNCLCEFDKYMRAVNGEGKPKQRYSGV